MDGIDAIKEHEALRKKLKRLSKIKGDLMPSEISDSDAFSYCNDDKCEYVKQIQENFIKNGSVPQIVDIEVFNQTY